jgi:lysozyme
LLRKGKKLSDVFRNYIKKNEGCRLFLYKCTSGKLTIGWGHNIQDLGISQAIANILFEEDYQRAFRQVADLIPNFMILNDARQLVLLDMIFNLGINGLSTFKKMLQAIKEENFEKAAKEILDSKYAKQCPNRANRNAIMMKQGIIKWWEIE